MASSLAFPSQGCYTVILNTFETYVYLAGGFAIGVLAMEVSGGALGGKPQGSVRSAYFPDPPYCKCLLLESFSWSEATDLCLSQTNENRHVQRGTPTSPQLCSPSALCRTHELPGRQGPSQGILLLQMFRGLLNLAMEL